MSEENFKKYERIVLASGRLTGKSGVALASSNWKASGTGAVNRYKGNSADQSWFAMAQKDGTWSCTLGFDDAYDYKKSGHASDLEEAKNSCESFASSKGWKI